MRASMMAEWLRDRYPEEITIVIQHWFDNLTVDDDGFAITLNFGNQPEPLYIPFDAITTFVDPSVEFGLKFETQAEDDEDDDEERADSKRPRPKPQSRRGGQPRQVPQVAPCARLRPAPSCGPDGQGTDEQERGARGRGDGGAGLDARIIEPGPSRTAEEAAAACGCALDQIVKSLIFQGESGRIYLFLTAGGNRLDPARAAALAGEPLGRADADTVRARPASPSAGSRRWAI
jgi:hypothetical protein